MAPVLEVAAIFRRHGEAFRQARAGHLGRGEGRVRGAITACRTAALGGHVEQCDDCGATRIAYNSCRNRHCPKCQGLARVQWLADRQAELLDQLGLARGGHFDGVATVVIAPPSICAMRGMTAA